MDFHIFASQGLRSALLIFTLASEDGIFTDRVYLKFGITFYETMFKCHKSSYSAHKKIQSCVWRHFVKWRVLSQNSFNMHNFHMQKFKQTLIYLNLYCTYMYLVEKWPGFFFLKKCHVLKIWKFGEKITLEMRKVCIKSTNVL